MNLREMSLSEKLELAVSTTEYAILKLLLLSPDMLVRRAMLRNHYVTTDIVNCLAYDAALNVSYKAVNHIKCTIKREFNDISSPCVKCKVDERHLSCQNCRHKK